MWTLISKTRDVISLLPAAQRCRCPTGWQQSSAEGLRGGPKIQFNVAGRLQKSGFSSVQFKLKDEFFIGEVLIDPHLLAGGELRV